MDGDESRTSVFTSALLPPFLAVTAVTMILTALFAWLGPAESTRDTANVGKNTPTTPAACPTPPASSPPPSSPPPSSPPATSSAPPQSATPDPNRPAVVVLNQSGGTGLGRRVANRVRAAGWRVFKTGNFTGTVSTTTVYYPDGLRRQANALAKDLPGDPRVMERFSNLSDSRLTIVLTDDYGD